MPGVTIEKVKKSFGPVPVLHEVNLDIKGGEFMVLVGPSGCGKSTLLRMVAGLETVSGGTISIGDRVMNDVSPRDRGVAMVFQNYALYPHMTVRDNLSFSLKLAKVPALEIKSRVDEAAEILGIESQLSKKPGQLSGGQKQRVAMGRAMVRRPDVFLFDEPLSNLDAQLRVKMRSEISLLHRRLKSTIIYVTHEQVEAMTLADRIAVMYRGKLEQVGAPLDVYHNPRSQFVASFIGTPSMNFLPVDSFKKLEPPPGTVTVGFRPEATTFGGNDAPERFFLGTGKVNLIEPLGSSSYVHLQINDRSVICDLKSLAVPKLDEDVPVFAEKGALFYFAEDGKRLDARGTK